ncbi:Ankyrin repeat-containing domain protein, partial [Nannochloropsis gaditana]
MRGDLHLDTCLPSHPGREVDKDTFPGPSSLLFSSQPLPPLPPPPSTPPPCHPPSLAATSLPFSVSLKEAAFAYECCCQGWTGYLLRVLRARADTSLRGKGGARNGCEEETERKEGDPADMRHARDGCGGTGPGHDTSHTALLALPPALPPASSFSSHAHRPTLLHAVAQALLSFPLPQHYGRTPFMAACALGQAALLTSLLPLLLPAPPPSLLPSAFLDVEDETGATALSLAAAGGWDRVVGLLLQAGAD